jgi:hypothetical protein
MPLEKTATRVWKRLTREERLAAASAFWQETPAEGAGAALPPRQAPTYARRCARVRRGREGAQPGLRLDPGESVASALLVALHLGPRRAMLAPFLDAVGLPHENGILKDEEAGEPVSEEAARAGVRALAASFPRAEIETYLNTLWLQDPERWQALAASPEWLPG